MERENLMPGCQGKGTRSHNSEVSNTNARLRGVCTRSSEEAAVMAVERRSVQERSLRRIKLRGEEFFSRARQLLFLKSRMR